MNLSPLELYQSFSLMRITSLLCLLTFQASFCTGNTLTDRSPALPEIQEEGPPINQPVCIDKRPFPFGWPENGLPSPAGRRYFRKDYRRGLSELCLEILPNGQPNSKPNFGCICDLNGDISCSRGSMAPELVFYCEDSCDCPPKKRHRPKWLKAAVNAWRNRQQRARDARENSKSKAGGSGVELASVEQVDGASASTSTQTCAGDCLSYAGCDLQRRIDGCGDPVCTVKKQTTGRNRFALGSCFSMIDPLGKRQLGGVSCLCNQTYTSEECCWEKSGLVYENPVGVLGNLREGEAV